MFIAACPTTDVRYEQLCDPARLRQAWKLVRKGGAAPGVDGHTLEQFAAVADRELARIEADLRAGVFRFRPVRRVFLAKPGGGRRRVGIPTIRDRIVEQSLRLLIEPLVACGYAAGSFAYCSGRGVHQALDRLLHQRREGNVWILESDVQNFFDSIDHRILLAALRRLPVDEPVVKLVEASLRAGVRLGTRWFASRRGVAQGSPLSPMLANLYLTPVDHALAQQGHAAIRYADDLLVCCESRAEACRALADLTTELRTVRLAVNRAKTRVLDSRRDTFDFLGFIIEPHRLRPAEESVKRFCAAVEEVLGCAADRPGELVVDDLNRLLRSFGHYYRRCGVGDLFEQLDCFVQRRLDSLTAGSGRQDGSPVCGLVRLGDYLTGCVPSGGRRRRQAIRAAPCQPVVLPPAMPPAGRAFPRGANGYGGWGPCIPWRKR